MRIKAIIVGAIAGLALATLTAYAGTTAAARVSGSLVSLVAATTTVTRAADREAATVATRSTESAESEKLAEPAVKPIVAVKPVAPRVLQTTAACQQAIDSLKAMHQADVAEDATERAGQQPISAAIIAAERAEELAEIQPWRQALMSARTACMPQPTTACQAALTGLQALVAANRPQSWSELRNQIDLAGLRAAFTAVATACAHRD